MPNKPTQPFGRLRYSKDGKVRKEIFRLPDAKPEQERAAMVRFVELHNSTWPPPSIEDLNQLGEADNDFSARRAGEPLIFELTEIVDREFTDYLSREQFAAYSADLPRNKDLVICHSGDRIGVINVDARDRTLTEAVRAKINRYYSKRKSGDFWLVAFSVAGLNLETIRSGALHVSHMLARARSDLRQHGTGAFNDVWFTDLQTRPVRIWPEPVEEIPVVLPSGN